jgi:hypothetical protein
MANAMLGEATAGVAAAVTSARAAKILTPLSQENIHYERGQSQKHL